MYKRLAALCLALLLPVTALADTATEELDRIFKRFSTLGACVAVIQNGEVTFTHCYGQLRPGGADVTPDTAFQVGSIAKMVANIGLMQLVEKQNISLDSELGALFGLPIRHPDYPSTPITLRQWMTHTASLRDSGDYDQALAGNVRSLRTLFRNRAAYTFLSGVEPGTRREYTNFGGGLIGAAIEQLSGQPLDRYMQENVFGPLGITAAFQPALIPEETPLADIYHMPQKMLGKRLRADDTLLTAANPQTHYWLTAGKLIISAPDLCKLLIALCDGGVCGETRLLKESTVAEMIAVQNRRGSVACDSESGLFLNIITDSQVEGRTMYGHGGKAYGMLCAAYFDPADRTGVVMLTNGCRCNIVYNGVGMLGRAIMRVCYDEVIGPGHIAEDPFAVSE